MKFRAAILFSLCVTLSTWSQVTVPPPGQDLRKLKDAWNSPTPGTSLKMKESERMKVGEVTGIVFRLVVTRMSPEKKYDLWVWPSNKDPIRLDSNVQFDSAGTVLQSSDKQPFTLSFVGMSKGEAARAALLSDDQQVVASAKMIPFPIEVANGPCHVAVEQVILGQAFGVRGTGFAADEEVAISCKCKKNELRTQAKADAQGSWEAVLVPVEAGKESGTTPIEFVGRNCRLGLDLVWGKAALTYQ
ncbi:MAG: hypothetical protein LAO56_11555 [Acidobacteriia bacterium]|nr:hypothetical protein [Terriglobia bacterium]